MFRRRRASGGAAGGEVADDRRPVTSGGDPLADWAAGLEPRWQGPVQAAMASRSEFRGLLSQVPPGPTRDWLETLHPAIDEAVQRCAEAVWRAMNASTIASRLRVEEATEELKAARREVETLRRAGADTGPAEDRVRVLAGRHRAISEALNQADDAVGRLGELNVRLETAVARVASVVLRSTGGGHEELERELDDVLVGITALDAALEEFG